MSYKPVPVEAAADIGEKFDKCIVVIVSWDPESQQIHTTTWGKGDLKHKNLAADWGDAFTKTLGADLDFKKTYEDFREGK